MIRPDEFQGRTFESLREQYFFETASAETAKAGGEQLLHNADRCFMEAAPEGVVVIPNAAHQEDTERTFHVVRTYRRDMLRTGSPPAALVFSHNVPEGEESYLSRSDEVMHDVRRQNPGVPLSWAKYVYRPDTSIATIKKDPTDAVLAIAGVLHPDGVPRHFAVLNQDIDLERMSPWWLQRLLLPLRAGHLAAQANMRHARTYLPGPAGMRRLQFPNMDRVMFWYDLAVKLNPYSMHDTQTAINACALMAVGSYSPRDRIGEIRYAVQKINQLSSALGIQSAKSVQAYGANSPRRAYAAMQDKKSPYDMWGDDFTVHEEYRMAGFKGYRDISAELANEIITNLCRQEYYFGPGRALFDSVIWGLKEQSLEGRRRGPEEELAALALAQDRVRRYKKAADCILRASGLPATGVGI